MIGLIIPNTVVGNGGNFPPDAKNPIKYINLCSEPSFEL